MLQCYSFKSFQHHLLPQSPKVCSLHLCLFCCFAYRVIVTIFLNSMWVKVAQSCLTLCDPMDYTVNGILQARILEWVAFPFCRGSSQPRNQNRVSCIADRFFTNWAIGEPINIQYLFFSFWLTSLCIIGSRFIHLIRTDSNVFRLIAE